MNKTYLKTHGLDNKGYLYKINFFEWYLYDELKLKTDEGYDEKAFEEYLEIKGNDDHSKLLELLEEVNDYSTPIEEIVEQHFDMDNLCYWMAFHILIGNYDVGSRNYYLYSPLNSDKWYFISWDNDAAFSRTEHRVHNYSEGMSWERGMTQFLHIILFNRIFQEKEYRDMLTSAVEDLRANYLNIEKISSMVNQYSRVVKPYVYSDPDIEHAAEENPAVYDQLTAALPSEIEQNYQYYLETLEKPWPFFVGTPEIEDGKINVLWDAAYDMDGEDITYRVILARDCDYTDIIYQEDNLRLPEATFDMLPPGQYYLRVQAINESGYVQECYDYFSRDDGKGKAYGTKAFVVNADGSIKNVSNADG